MSPLDLSGKILIPCAQEDMADIIFCFFPVILIFDFLDKRIKEALIHLISKGVFHFMPLYKVIVKMKRKIEKSLKWASSWMKNIHKMWHLKEKHLAGVCWGEYIND